MTKQPEMRDFSPGAGCIRASELGETLEDMMESSSSGQPENAAKLLTYGAAETAGDSEGMDMYLTIHSETGSETELAVLNRAYLASAYVCGQAIGRGHCGKWQYDTEQHQVVPRGERPALTIE